MAQKWDDSGFEGYRRDRKRRHLATTGPKRDMGRRAGVLRELEQAEHEEMRNEQMSREVHEFFSDATRTAASIVAKVAEEQETVQCENISQDMLEFLHDAISRAQALITQLRSRQGGGVGMETIETDVHNIVGQQLDQFRHEGTAQLHDKHIGQDPFADVELPDMASVADEPLTIDEHLVADTVEPEPKANPDVEVPEWLAKLDTPKLQTTLKMLVSQQVMSKEDAIAIFYALTEA